MEHFLLKGLEAFLQNVCTIVKFPTIAMLIACSATGNDTRVLYFHCQIQCIDFGLCITKYLRGL